ncbi:M protein [Rhizoctonia solani rhabdovirus 1]|nr:M protein [Rhizoctonia solani rhabdovirus 1]
MTMKKSLTFLKDFFVKQELHPLPEEDDPKEVNSKKHGKNPSAPEAEVPVVIETIKIPPPTTLLNGEIFFKFEMVTHLDKHFDTNEYISKIQILKDANNLPYHMYPMIAFFYLYATSIARYKKDVGEKRMYMTAVKTMDCRFYLAHNVEDKQFEYSGYIPGRRQGKEFRVNFELTYLPSKIRNDELYGMLLKSDTPQMFKISKHLELFGIKLDFKEDVLQIGNH